MTNKQRLKELAACNKPALLEKGWANSVDELFKTCKPPERYRIINKDNLIKCINKKCNYPAATAIGSNKVLPQCLGCLYDNYIEQPLKGPFRFINSNNVSDNYTWQTISDELYDKNKLKKRGLF